ncbi:NAD(P)/FAD-dependent oxidoreductase [Rhizorhapis suberifaciens]|uniref:Flavin-dependent dehydrogenase n=1 Tax=Rhizorhapis suberifaciens TaxID=13656 RepID=A0A840HT88_9SPHN|nr:FAD-dependent monooxygenase [Rhizorhapis suberifaciens]MBB4640768.1 flavin-dependent dehydrogenase [Rhizorhapis suberifaciens]
MRRTNPLIIGGGPAGAAAALHLLRFGAEPTIIERQVDTGDALCGGFLSWRTLEQLAALGIGQDELGGHAVTTLRLFVGKRPYEIPLPARAMGLSRRRLDRLLLATAEQMGAVVWRGIAVQSFGPDGVRLDNGGQLASDSLFLATGKYDLRGLQRPRLAAGEDPMLGLRVRLPPLEERTRLIGGHIEIHLFEGGYLGLVLQEDGSANACMAVRKSVVAKTQGQPATLFMNLADSRPALADRLAGLIATTPVDSVAHIPYGWRARNGMSGLFRLGDQAGVIASLAGEGIGLALASAESSVRCWGNGGGAAAPIYQRAFSQKLRRPLAIAGLISDLADKPPLGRIAAEILSRVPALSDLISQASRVWSAPQTY